MIGLTALFSGTPKRLTRNITRKRSKDQYERSAGAMLSPAEAGQRKAGHAEYYRNDECVAAVLVGVEHHQAPWIG
jgi:hypothetical protein